jgi:small ligand-binding sensory domain FIST
MPAAAQLIDGPFLPEAVRVCAEAMREACGGSATCAFAFVSEDYMEDLEEFCDLVRLHGHVPRIFGCTASGLAGSGLETENQCGASLLFLNLPGCHVHSLELTTGDAEGTTPASSWHRRAGLEASQVDAWILLANPLALKVEPWLASWNAAWPGIPTVGGLASSRQGTEGIAVFCDGHTISGGGLGIALGGGLTIHTATSQGCRPIGEPLTITRAQDHVVLQLGGQTAFAALNDVITAMTDEERTRARGNIFAGLAVNEYQDELSTGDFLVRNIVAADPASGALVVGAWPRTGQTLQYQLRDKDTAEADYRRTLEALQPLGTPLASLMFTCTGRGQSFFGQPGHDTRMLEQLLGPHPSAGLFCNGEIGPVGGRAYAHGYTTTLALLYAKEAPPPAAQPTANS